MTIRSKTHQGEGFNELAFEDAKDREQMFIHAQKDMNIVVKDSQNLLIEKGSLTEIIKQARNTKSDTVRIEAESKIELIVGSGSIIMTEDDITLTFASSSIKLDASAIDQNGPLIYLNKGGGGAKPSDVEHLLPTGMAKLATPEKNLTSPSSTDTPVTAKAGQADGRDTLITYSDGTTQRRSGGTLAWRNNNPGNIRAGDFANSNGAIGTGPNGFAVFPNEETGNEAIGTLLQSKNYRNLNINDAVARYAPPVENDTAAYQRQLQRITGLDGSRIMNNLNDNELGSVVKAIRQYEGWNEGTITIEE